MVLLDAFLDGQEAPCDILFKGVGIPRPSSP
jgi:hypothetical protein